MLLLHVAVVHTYSYIGGVVMRKPKTLTNKRIVNNITVTQISNAQTRIQKNSFNLQQKEQKHAHDLTCKRFRILFKM